MGFGAIRALEILGHIPVDKEDHHINMMNIQSIKLML